VISNPGRPRRILSLGDSYTIGEGVDARDCWPVQLAAQLRERGIGLGEPTIVAQTGWTTDELSRGIDAAHLDPPYDLVTLLIGVNDQFRGASAEDYRPRFRALLDRAMTLAADDPSRVIVVSIPDWSVTPFAEGHDRSAIAAAIRAFNAVNREETTRVARSAARWVDITESSRGAARDPGLLAADGLHPSAAMYAEWVQLVLAAAGPQIKSGRS
jgi:lysophospholipase L1-like esterase